MLLSLAKPMTIYTFVIIFIETRDTPFNVCPPIEDMVASKVYCKVVDKKLINTRGSLWLIHTARDRDRDRDREMMGFCIMLYTVHTTQGQGQGQVTIVFYCTHPGPGPCPVPGPVQCE